MKQMKNIKYIFLFIVGIFLITSCEDEAVGPIISYGDAPVLTSSQPGGTFLLTQEDAASTLFTFTWTKADFGFPAAISYIVQMDEAGNNFASATELTTTSDMSYTVTVGDLNGTLTALEFEAGVQTGLEIRVVASVGTSAQTLNSGTFEFDVIPYSVKLPPIYLLGSATDIGWDNLNALPAPFMSNGIYGLVAHLKANEWIKFIHTLGQWTPQWGTDANGTNTGGNLVYRPTEDVDDPSSIPSPDVEGDYRVVADIINLTYVVYPIPEVVYLVGGATTVGWTPTNGIPFTKDGVGQYSLTTDLSTGNGGMKIMASNSGAWAPQWGTNAKGTTLFGTLEYRAADGDPDPAEIPEPTSAGTYKITIDFTENTYKIEKQ